MKTTTSVTGKPGNQAAMLPAGMEVRNEAHIINRGAFRKKYDAMLNLVEFMASLCLVGAKNSRVDRKMAELKTLVKNARNGLDSCRDTGHQINGGNLSGKAGSHG